MNFADVKMANSFDKSRAWRQMLKDVGDNLDRRNVHSIIFLLVIPGMSVCLFCKSELFVQGASLYIYTPTMLRRSLHGTLGKFLSKSTIYAELVISVISVSLPFLSVSTLNAERNKVDAEDLRA